MENANHLLAEAFEAFEIENWAQAERLYRNGPMKQLTKLKKILHYICSRSP